jgi:hypothetical protein
MRRQRRRPPGTVHIIGRLAMRGLGRLRSLDIWVKNWVLHLRERTYRVLYFSAIGYHGSSPLDPAAVAGR